MRVVRGEDDHYIICELENNNGSFISEIQKNLWMMKVEMHLTAHYLRSITNSIELVQDSKNEHYNTIVELEECILLL